MLAPALTLGPALFAAYTYTTVVLGQEFARYPGNVEPFFPRFAGLVALGVALAAITWSWLARRQPVLPGEGLRRLLAGIFFVIGVCFALTWAAQIRQVVAGAPSIGYLGAPDLFWTIKLLDFGLLIPLWIATGVGLLRRWPWATAAACGLVTFSTCLALAIAGMGLAVPRRGEPSADPVLLGVTQAAGLGLAVVTVCLFRSGRVAEADQPPAPWVPPDAPLPDDRRSGAG